jgi:hypothetical protein
MRAKGWIVVNVPAGAMSIREERIVAIESRDDESGVMTIDCGEGMMIHLSPADMELVLPQLGLPT